MNDALTHLCIFLVFFLCAKHWFLYTALFHLSYYVGTLPMSINILWIYHFSGYRWTLKLFLVFYHSEHVAMNIFLPVSISSALSNQRLEMFLWFLISNIHLTSKGYTPRAVYLLHCPLPTLRTSSFKTPYCSGKKRATRGI